jgi:YD repeat-containing protein
VRLTDTGGNPIGWRYTVAATEQAETYDNSGKLISVANRAGVSQTLAYDTSGRLSTVTDAFGRSLSFNYDANNRISTLTVPGGGTYAYTYTAANNVSSVTYPDTKVRTYVYNESANTSGANLPYAMTGIIDEASTRFATFKYDSSTRVLSSEHAGSAEKYSFSYLGSSTTVTDPLNTARTYNFTTSLGVARNTAVSQPCTSGCSGGGAAATSYDANGNVAARTDFNGNKTCYAYDTARNLETFRLEGLASGLSCPANLATYTPTAGTRQRKISTQWNATHRLPSQIDEAGKRTTFTHDAIGNVLTKTVLDISTSESRTWSYTYDGYGRILTADGPRTDVSDVTTYTYYNCATGYQCGQVQTITNALGHVTTYNTYNVHGQPLTITDPNGVVTTLTYDLRQRLTSRTVGTEQTTFAYWPTGLLKKTTLPDGSFLQYTYDAAHRLTEIQDSEGNRIVYTLDNMGNRTAENVYDPSSLLTQTHARL